MKKYIKNGYSSAATMLCLSIISTGFPPPVYAQNPVSGVILEINGDIPAPVMLSLEDLRMLPRTSITIEEDGLSVTYEGVLIDTLIDRAGAPTGDVLRGAALASYVLVKAADDYQVLFSLGELDHELSGHQILVADEKSGVSLPAPQGPLRLIVPSDLRAARSVRMLATIEIVQLSD